MDYDYYTAIAGFCKEKTTPSTQGGGSSISIGCFDPLSLLLNYLGQMDTTPKASMQSEELT